MSTTAERRKAMGLCTYCGKEVEPERAGKNLCAACAKRKSDKAKEKADMLMVQNKCVRCGGQKESGRTGLRLCRQCAEKELESQKKTAYKRIISNLCANCGGPKEKEGEAYCKKCDIMLRKKNKKSLKELHDRRKKQGLCVTCGKKLEPERAGMTNCKECSEKHTKVNNRYLEKRKKEGLCVRCGDYRLGEECTGTLCASCAEKQREYNNNRKTKIRIKAS